MAQQFSNNGSSFLALSIDTEDTSLAVSTGTGILFPLASLGTPEDFFVITVEDVNGEFEIMRCVDRSGDILTVQRAQEGTFEHSFPQDSRVELRMTRDTVKRFIQRNDDGGLFTNLDFGTKRAFNLAEGVEDGDAVTVSQLTELGKGGEELATETRRTTTDFALAGGVDGDSITANFATPFESLEPGMRCTIRISHDNEETDPTLNVDNLGVVPVVRSGGKQLVIGDMQTNMMADFIFYDGAWELLNPIKPRLEDSIDLIYPLNSIYINYDDATNPEELFGRGTWEQIAEGRVLVGVGELDDEEYLAGEVGGSKDHELTVAEMPEHAHELHHYDGTKAHDHQESARYGIAGEMDDLGTTQGNPKAKSQDGTILDHNIVLDTGGGEAHTNMQPFLAVYIWRRTAL